MVEKGRASLRQTGRRSGRDGWQRRRYKRAFEDWDWEDPGTGG